MDKTSYNESVYRRCISQYGEQNQVDMCLEEMSELTKALLKYRRKLSLIKGECVNSTSDSTDLKKAREDIIDELADVKIMVRQMEMIFRAEEEVSARIDFKVSRQVKRLFDAAMESLKNEQQ